MLKVSHVSKKFGAIEAVKDVTFSVEKGQIAALLGENGAGKSTLLRLISGYFEADEGNIVLCGTDSKQKREQYLANLGYVPEISELYSEMTVYDFLDFNAKIRRLSGNKGVEQIVKAVKQMALNGVLWQKCETLSKGYKKRVELAAALLAEPKLLLLDEPTEGLDPNQKQILRRVIKDYAGEHAVIISTHTLEDVDALASQILLIHKGRLKANTDLKQFKQTAENDLLQSFRQATEN